MNDTTSQLIAPSKPRSLLASQENQFALQAKLPLKYYLARTLLSVMIISSLTACGGGGSTPVVPDPTTNTTETPIDPRDYNFVAPPYDQSTLAISYNNSDKIIPVLSDPLPDVSLSDPFQQQSVTNANDVWALGHTGLGITIGVVDSGVNPNHVDFFDDSSNTRINWNDARSVNSTDGTDIVMDNNYIDIDDPEYHGTHVSSIALGREYGVAPEATLLPVNVFFDNDSAYNTAIHTAINYAASKAPIVNASITGMVNLSTIGYQQSEFNAYLTTLKNYDSALIVAAGNGGVDSIGDPVGAEHFINHDNAQNLAIQTAISNQVLSVIAINDAGVRASFSNYPGSCSDVGSDADLGCNTTVMTDIQNTFISAPGGNPKDTEEEYKGIEAAYGGDTTGTVSYSGTSMATPVVSGGLALLMSAWDNLTIQQAVKLLKDNANKSFTGYSAAEYGVGILDIRAAFEPSGELKSTASVSSTASYSLTESSASIPASLSGLAKLPALKSVAYFDDYNRDYSVDITPAIQIEKNALDWNQFWVNSQSNLATSVDLDDYALSVSFDNTQSNVVKSLALQNQYSTFQYFKNSSNSLIETSSNPLASHFYSNNQQDFGATLMMQQAITPKLALFTAVQEQDNSFSRVQNTQNETLAQVQTMGLSYQLTNHVSLGLSSQLRQEQDSLMGLQGSGTFSFGENNQSQLNTFSLQYSHNDIQLFSQLQQGQLLSSNKSAGSYINIEQAEMGQFKLGVMQALSPQASWGLQAYNYNSLLQSDISLTLPIGMSSTGDVVNQTIRYTQKNSLQPDTVELFYKAGSANALQYQLNAIHSPDDSGMGLKLYQRF
ncbi:MAG: S8 family serine peptidase [Pseudomonadota bacterium]|nr:S8 family serine peptidase [Pseudomonadota bacterium]